MDLVLAEARDETRNEWGLLPDHIIPGIRWQARKLLEYGAKYSLTVDHGADGRTVAVVHIPLLDGVGFTVPKSAVNEWLKPENEVPLFRPQRSPVHLMQAFESANQIWVKLGGVVRHFDRGLSPIPEAEAIYNQSWANLKTAERELLAAMDKADSPVTVGG